MAERLDTLLAEGLDAWDDTRSGLIEEVANIPAERFLWRPAEGARSVAELVRHVLESARMMVGELTRPDGDFRRQAFGAFMEEYASGLAGAREKEALLAHLREDHEAGVAAFRAVGEIHMLQRIRRFDGEEGTRLAWMHHGIAHEYYHRGQVALYARIMGLTPALTRRIEGS